ncbi:MAG TPA: PDZ domain-containing protein [Vicinamibacterales bacterium]|nr:PDZ domain-containing protein [Vicinamibacterales bacterium]
MKGFRHIALAGALVLATGALPASTAHGQNRELVRALGTTHGGRIGVSVRDVEDSAANDPKRGTAGVVVDSVEPGGPADKAGVKTGDAITEFDGERVRSVRQFSRLVQETPAGRAVPVALSREGQRTTVTVTAAQASFGDDFALRLLDVAPPAPPTPPAAMRVRPAVPAPPFEYRLGVGRRLGLSVETLDDQLAQYFGVKEGVLVKSVEADSAAQKAGIKAGDVITAVNGRQVYEASDLTRALDRMDNTDEFTIEVMREKKAQSVKGKLEPRSRARSSMF